MLNATYLDFLAIFGIGGAHPGGLQLTKHIFKTENLDATKRMLDAGCGTGQSVAYLSETYRSHITALDKNEMMVEKATKRFSSSRLPVQVVQGDIEKLTFEDRAFDYVLLESVLAFTNIPVAINECFRVLKPNGRLIAIEPVLQKTLTDEALTSIIDFYHFSQIPTESNWYQLFQNAGFKQINIEKFNLKARIDNVENAPDFSLSENIDEGLFALFEKHQHLTDLYKDGLGFRIFRCSY